MKKKIILFSLLAALVLGMTACNNENNVPEVTEQTISISETVTEKPETTSQSETGTEKTETTETSEEAKTTLTVNDETHATVKEENVTESVTNETKEENENKSEEFSFDNITINIFGEEHTLPIYVNNIKTEGWYLEQVEYARYDNSGFYVLGGSLIKNDENKSMQILVASNDKTLSDDDRIISLIFSFTGDWSLGKIKSGMSREHVNNIYNNFTTIDDGSDYHETDNKVIYISYDKFDNVSGIAIKGI